MTAMSEDAIRQRAAELGAVYIGASEFKEILDALETLSLESGPRAADGAVAACRSG